MSKKDNHDKHCNCGCNDDQCNCNDEQCNCDDEHCNCESHQHSCGCHGQHGTSAQKLIDLIFDEENSDNILIEDDEGNVIEFEQIAVIPQGEDIYLIAHPINMPDVDDYDAFVFLVKPVENGDDVQLFLVEDEKIIQKVFGEYNRMYEEAVAKGEIDPDDED